MKKTLSNLIIFFTFIYLHTAFSQYVDRFRILNLTLDTFQPGVLHLNHGRLIWTDNDINSSTFNLKLYTGAEIIKLDSNLTDVTADLDGDYVAWTDLSNWVKSFNIRTRDLQQFGAINNHDPQQIISVAGNLVAYPESRMGGGSQLVIHLLDSGTDTLFDAGKWNLEPSLDQGQLAWIATDEDQPDAPSDVYYYNGYQVKKISITSTTRKHQPVLKDGMIVWREGPPVLGKVQMFNGETILTLVESNSAVQKITGYDASDGNAVAAVTDTLAQVSKIKLYESGYGTTATLDDSALVSSLKIDNDLITWASGETFNKILKVYHISTGILETLGATDNPVVDDECIAWTLGDAVEMRVPLTDWQVTSDLKNGWTQSRFKPIDQDRLVWGNYQGDLKARLFYSNGSATQQLTDSVIYKDFIMANDGNVIWREDFNSLWLYDGHNMPRQLFDSLQCENMYIAEGAIGFHGFRIDAGNSINQSWLYLLGTDSLIQLTSDTSANVNNRITLVEGDQACWLRTDGDQTRLMYYDGNSTIQLSSGETDNFFAFRNGKIVWSEEIDGILQVMLYDVHTESKTQITTDPQSAFGPTTDGQVIVWFSGSGSNLTMVYYNIETLQSTIVTNHFPSPLPFRWLWLSNGRIAWSSAGEILVFDGNVISRLTDSGSFRPNIEPYVDNELVLWNQESPINVPPDKYGDLNVVKLHAHVDFTARNIAGPAPLTVTFQNNSWQGVQSCSWDFGDNQHSLDYQPSHIYTAPGTYTVSLTVTGPAGAAVEIKKNLVRVEQPSSIIGAESNTPKQFKLYQNYPNPFNPSTRIEFDLPIATDITINIYNSLGQKLSTLVDGFYTVGKHRVIWNTQNISSGVYFYELKTESYRKIMKMVLIR